MPQGGSPMWFGAVQFGFSLLWGLVGCKLELQLRKLDTLRGFKFGGLGLRWVVLSNALTATANPSPPNLKPRQTRHHSHTAQLLSCSFKPAAPIHPGAGTPPKPELQLSKTTTSKPARLQVWWARVCRHSQDTRDGRLPKPQPTTCAAHTNNRFQRALPFPCPTLSLTGTSGGPPRRQ